MHICYRKMIACVLVVYSSLSFAVQVNSVYKAEVPVLNQSADVKQAAIREGLTDVYIKVSGSQQVMENNPGLEASLNHAAALVKESKYVPLLLNADKKTYLLRLRFEEAGVNKNLTDMNVPIWAATRPLILGWIAYEGQGVPLDFVDDASTSDIRELLKKSTKQRGLAFIFPLLDISELGQVSVEDVVKKNVKKLQLASKRYDSNALLFATLKQKSSGITSEWTFILEGETYHWTIKGGTLKAVIDEAVNNISDAQATRFAVVSPENEISECVLNVQAIQSQADLLHLMKFLQRTPTVSAVQLVSIKDDMVILNLHLRGNKKTFLQAVNESKNIQSLPAKNEDDDVLFYKWVH